jgi:hypothetical protein
MAQFHISKDPPDKTPVAWAYSSFTKYIVFKRHGLDSKYISFWHYDLDQPSGLWNYKGDFKYIVVAAWSPGNRRW